MKMVDNKMKEVFFKDFINLKRGYDLPHAQCVEGEYPVVGASGIRNYHKSYKVECPTVITGRSGTLGLAQYVDEPCTPLNTTLYVTDFKGNNPLYVYYYLKLMNLENFNSGAGVPTLNKNHLSNLKIKIHERVHQDLVVERLEEYDKLIKNYQIKISKLENIISLLYNKYFNASVSYSPTSLNTLCNESIYSGGTPDTSIDSYWNGEFKFFSSGETRDKRVYFTNRTITATGVENSSTKLAKRYSIVIASAGQGKTRGQTTLLMTDMYVNQSVIVLDVQDEINLPYVFENIFRRYDELRQISDAASIRGSLSKDILKEFIIEIPPRDLLVEFNNLYIPMLNVLEKLELKIEYLKKNRDLIVPKLLAGHLKLN